MVASNLGEVLKVVAQFQEEASMVASNLGEVLKVVEQFQEVLMVASNLGEVLRTPRLEAVRFEQSMLESWHL